jgi:hypothetical protein
VGNKPEGKFQMKSSFNSILAGHASGIILLGTLASAPAQSTWNYVLSDAGDGNSLLTWSVTGDLATAGSVLVVNESNLMASITAPGIYVDGFEANGAPQLLATPDGSQFKYVDAQIYSPIVGYFADSAAAGGDDSFGLLSAPLPSRDIGQVFSYQPGTQSTLISIPFSNFNPGTYQSQDSEFGTPLTVNLVVTAIPEPSTLTFGVAALICVLLSAYKACAGGAIENSPKFQLRG